MIAQPERAVAVPAPCCCKPGACDERRRRRYPRWHPALPRGKRWRPAVGLPIMAALPFRSHAMRPLPVSRLVNDLHSALNATSVAGIHAPRSIADIRDCILDAARQGLPVATCGGRHAMGGQQFALDAMLLDMRHMDRVLS